MQLQRLRIVLHKPRIAYTNVMYVCMNIIIMLAYWLPSPLYRYHINARDPNSNSNGTETFKNGKNKIL